eukprot:g2032.t1
MKAVVDTGARPKLNPRTILATLIASPDSMNAETRCIVCAYVRQLLSTHPRRHALDAAAFITQLPSIVGANDEVLDAANACARVLARVDRKTAKRFARELDRTKSGFYKTFKDSAMSSSALAATKVRERPQKLELTRLVERIDFVDRNECLLREAAPVLLGDARCRGVFGRSDEEDDTKRTGDTREAPALVGIDCEWPPNGGLVSILQIATRDRAFLFDADALTNDTDVESKCHLRKLLDALFDCRSPTYKVGFQLVRSDIPKLFERNLLSTSSELCRVVDVGCMYYYSDMYRRTQKVLKGLKSLVEIVLHRTLDKTEQCSDWSARPLRRSQIEYAARDSLCVVDIAETLSRRRVEDGLCVQRIRCRDTQREEIVKSGRALFQQLDLRCGVVVRASRLPKSKRLLQLDVRIGDDSRTVRILSALASEYDAAQLIDTYVLVISNVVPYKLCGSVSFGGLLCAYPSSSDSAGPSIELVRPSRACAIGSRVLLGDESIVGSARGLLDVGAPGNAWALVSPLLTTEKNGRAVLRLHREAIPLTCGGSDVYAETIRGGTFR